MKTNIRNDVRLVGSIKWELFITCEKNKEMDLYETQQQKE